MPEEINRKYFTDRELSNTFVAICRLIQPWDNSKSEGWFINSHGQPKDVLINMFGARDNVW